MLCHLACVSCPHHAQSQTTEGIENPLLSQMRWGGGGTPSIDEPDKTYPQPDITEIEYEDEAIDYSEAIAWSTRYNEEIARRKDEDPSYAFSLSGSGTESDPYLIQDEYDFYYIRNKTNGYHFKLTNDIYLNDGKFIENEETGEIEYFSRKSESDGLYSWPEIQSFKNCTIDGNGHNIFGFYGLAIFRKYLQTPVTNCVFKNINFKNSYSAPLYGAPNVDYECCHAILAGTISDCIVENVNTYGWVDGAYGTHTLIYSAKNTTFASCTNYAHNYGSPWQYCAGGIVGNANNCVVKNCENYGNICVGKGDWVGGIVGTTSNGTTIQNCKNYGNLNETASGGIVYSLDSSSKVSNCINDGLVYIGICCSGSGVVLGCVNYANCEFGIACSKYTGKGMRIENCINYGDIKGPQVSGIGNASYISNCINYGNIDSGYGAGICSTSYGSSCPNITIIENCKNYGSALYGIMCDSNTTSIITNCVNYADCRETGIAGKNASCYMCKNYGRIKNGSGIVNSCNAQGEIVDCENHGKTGNSGICGDFRGKMLRCHNFGNSYYGLVGTTYNGAIIRDCEAEGEFNFYFGGSLKSGAIIKNCLIKGSASNSNGIASTNNATIDGVIFIGKINGVQKNQYFGDNFDAFFVKWKTGYIGLKALESAGVYMFAIPDEVYLQQIGYTKAG